MAKQSKAPVKKATTKQTTPKKGAPKKSISKETAPSPAAVSQADIEQQEVTVGKLSGKTFTFVGMYKDNDQEAYQSLIESFGGRIVEHDAPNIDYLYIGYGRNGKPPADAAKIQKRIPTVHSINGSDLDQLLLPSREELLREISRGKHFESFWACLETMLRRMGVTIDLQAADLAATNLEHARLVTTDLTSCKLRGAQLSSAYFPSLEDADLQECSGNYTRFGNLKDCNLSSANLENCTFFEHRFLDYAVRQALGKKVENCKFAAAKLCKLDSEEGTFTDCDFRAADLTEAGFKKARFERVDFSKANLTQLRGLAAKFNDAIFYGANLSQADLRDASLVNADLRNANLRQAVLYGADLTGAKLDGADLQDVIWAEAKFDPQALKKAKNVNLPELRQPGQKLLELAQATATAVGFETTCELKFPGNEQAQLTLHRFSETVVLATAAYTRGAQNLWYRQRLATLEQAMLEVACRWPQATLRLDSITAKGSKSPRGKKLLDLVTAAWAESFGKQDLNPEQLEKEQASQQAAAQQEREELIRRIRKEGPEVWSELRDQVKRNNISFHDADFSNANLKNIELSFFNLRAAKFVDASLYNTGLGFSECQNADFTNATMLFTKLGHAILTGAKFNNALISNAYFNNTKLQGADFTGATLSDTIFDKAQYDETTIWPQDFVPSNKMVWKGKGPKSGVTILPAAKPGTLDFDSFLKDLGNKVEAARMDKAGSMLKAERFQLFAEVKDTGIVGVVKSQSSGDLVYSCWLNSDGNFGCCTQNLRPCGGLRGALCKHLLVLIVGLAKAGQLDPATVNLWVDLSTNNKPAIDEDAMSATFLRYKGAESGELDWRPTETIPEDFYAM